MRVSFGKSDQFSTQGDSAELPLLSKETNTVSRHNWCAPTHLSPLTRPTTDQKQQEHLADTRRAGNKAFMLTKRTCIGSKQQMFSKFHHVRTFFRGKVGGGQEFVQPWFLGAEFKPVISQDSARRAAGVCSCSTANEVLTCTGAPDSVCHLSSMRGGQGRSQHGGQGRSQHGRFCGGHHS